MMMALVPVMLNEGLTMNNIFARCIGLAGRPDISIDAAIILLHRHGKLRRCEARVAVLDYLGLQREELCEQLGITPGTIDKYWTRIYSSSGHHGRQAVRAWVEALLAQAVVE
jgi:DNA-binding CsgD family transcriptional regulator